MNERKESGKKENYICCLVGGMYCFECFTSRVSINAQNSPGRNILVAVLKMRRTASQKP